MTKIKHAKIVRSGPVLILFPKLTHSGGGLGHRKYECPEKRNVTSNVICRICGNAGHMARDCRDRQKGSDWRNTDSFAPQADAVEREYDVCPPLRVSLT